MSACLIFSLLYLTEYHPLVILILFLYNIYNNKKRTASFMTADLPALGRRRTIITSIKRFDKTDTLNPLKKRGYP